MDRSLASFSWFRLLVLVLMILATGGGRTPALADGPNLDLPGLEADSAAYARQLRLNAPPQINQALDDDMLKQGREAVAAHDFARAVTAFERALWAGDTSADTWMALAQAQAGLTPPKLDRALQAGWRSLDKSAAGQPRMDTLVWLAQLLDGPLSRPQSALAAYRAAAKEADEAHLKLSDAAVQRMAELRLTVGLQLKNSSVMSDESPARLCLTFSDRLKTGRDTHFDDFVRLDPPVPVTVLAADDQLCVSGLSHGTKYHVTVRQGLPGVDGLVLEHDESQDVAVEDMSPSVAFRGQSFILVRGDPGGLPLVTVNLETVGIKLYRINDRNLPGQVKENALLGSLSDYQLRTLEDTDGELVWQGKLSVSGKRNQETVTGLPIRTVLPDPKPGLYAVAAEPLELPEGRQAETATQWLMITDLGLTTTRGADGIHVLVRSLASAKPLAGAEVALIARNNAELGKATTDADGHAVFAAPLTRGSGGQTPQLVTVYTHDGDFALLDLTMAAFDLSDRGVGGRPPPGPLDAYLYTDRGVYRPGETVNLTALLRDDGTKAVEDFPLTVKVLRPSGTEFYSGVLKPSATGAYVLPVPLSATAPQGGWSVQAYGDPKGDPIGKVGFQVEAFVPERLAVTLTQSQPTIESGHPYDLLVASRFLYGAPAAGLAGTADVALDEDPDPYPALKGYRFGLAQEQVTARVTELTLPAGDAEGKAHLTVDLPPQPDTTKPLHAVIRVAVAEPGGRPTRKAISLPVRTQSYAIGIKAGFGDEDRLGEGQTGTFEIIAVDGEGRRLAKDNLRWELIAEHHSFQWYYADGHYKYRVTESDQSLRGGPLSLSADKPAVQATGPLPYGRYRLEVFDAATGVATSVRFDSGWEEEPSAGDTPDTVEVTSDRPAYSAGETAHIHIQPPFAGEMLLTVATDRLLTVRTLSVPKGGATVDVPVDAAWGPGAYVTATVYRPPVHGKERLPVRAIGLTWVALDTTARSLTVAIDLPGMVRPGQTLEVPVRLTPGSGSLGGEAGPAYVTLAAVDEGILQLTQFISPDPGKHYFAKRVLGLDLRDDYGRLIDTVDGPMGMLRQGGDTGGLAAGLPKVPITVVSLFQGPVMVDAQGRASVRLTIPDFDGELRLMAVAFDRQRLGAFSRPLTVRDPLVAEASLPRFLAPADQSQLTLSLHNVEAPAGRYQVSVTGQGPVRLATPAPEVTLAAGERQTLVLPLTADTAGVGGVVVEVKGPLDGAPVVAVHQEIGLTVRPSRPVESTFVVRQIPPGTEAGVDASALSGYIPGTSGLSLSYSSGPPFDVAGLLAALDRYPYGCLEQLTSRAMPLLVVNDVALALGSARKPDDNLDGRVNQAISALLDKQRYDGAFGLWSAHDEAQPWLTAYALEFLTRARNLKHPVPDAPYLDGLTWLRKHAIEGDSGASSLASRAYAFYTLSLAGVPTPGPLRYFDDTFLKDLPTPLAKGQVGAALARLGDRDRAVAAFDAAFSNLARDYWGDDYGSTVRDAAGLVSLLTEAGMAGDQNRLARLIDRLPVSSAAVARTNTQEQAWLVLAADTLMRNATPLTLTRGGQPLPKADPLRLEPGGAELTRGIKIRNAGRQPLWQAVTVYGVPVVAGPAASAGLKIKRYFFHRDGTPVNLDQIHQNDVFVVVLNGSASTKLFHQALVSQPLPAGWEIENQALGAGGVEDLGWLKDQLSEPVAAELRDDRYIAAIDLTEDKAQFELAFLVRAVTPGVYELPGANLVDMYQPDFFARQAAGRITVLPAAP